MFDGIQNTDEQYYLQESCYEWNMISYYGLCIIPIVTSFFSILGMSIERFQTFALYRDRRRLTKRFSVVWFTASWFLAFCFLVVLISQLEDVSNSTSVISSKDSELTLVHYRYIYQSTLQTFIKVLSTVEP